jgi:hypothetical protein
MEVMKISGSPQMQIPAVAQKPTEGTSKPIQAKSQPATDTVQISSAAKQILQEATETAAQTAQEARGGDLQAKRLLARIADAKGGEKAPSTSSIPGAQK